MMGRMATLTENDDCVQVGIQSACIQSQTGIMGVMSEHWNFYHISIKH